MHENREISRTPWSDDQGRSAKATSRNADTHVPEKSDCVVVPVNQPNKGGQPSAEAGEGRAQTRENIIQSHMHPTQTGKRMSQGLDGVRKAAKERKQERFTALLHHLNVDLLRDSFYALQRKASPGVDGVTWQEYETGLEDRLVDLHSRVHRGTYRAKPSRRVFIPKADGRQHPLGIAALEDKVVQQAVVTILSQIYEVDCTKMGLPLRSPVAKLSCEAATEENAKRRSFMPRTQVTGKANFSPGITSGLPVTLEESLLTAPSRQIGRGRGAREICAGVRCSSIYFRGDRWRGRAAL